ncbi:unnamed protein product [Tilletia controversa]|nr:unnamed protein product [Tilletia controversa]
MHGVFEAHSRERAVRRKTWLVAIFERVLIISRSSSRNGSLDLKQSTLSLVHHRTAPDLPSLRTWFATHHPALALPDNVLLQLITHESHNLAHRHASPQQGHDILTAGAHNRRLSFLGRRALHAFLALFLHGVVSSSTAQEARRAADEILRSPDALDVILHTGRLGDRPGRALELEQVMRWTPAHSEQERGAHDRGLYTIRGRTLEAFIGAIYHQHGANLASQTFHAHILPHIDAFPPDTPRTLWDAIKARADVDRRALVDLQAWAQGKRVELGYGSAALASPAQGKQVE